MSDPYGITFDSAPVIDLLHPDGRIRQEFVENVKLVSE
jgi:beta-glucosidase-like glycosyl hydrolase